MEKMPWEKNLGFLDLNNIEDSLKDPENYEKLKQLVKEKIIDKGGSTNDIFEIPQSMLRTLYEHGHTCYEKGNIDAALHFFLLLNLIDNKNYAYSFSIAACLHRQKDYELAANMYKISFQLNSNNPLALYHIADCYIQIDQKENALNALKDCIELCGNKEEYKDVKEKSSLMLERLKK